MKLGCWYYQPYLTVNFSRFLFFLHPAAVKHKEAWLMIPGWSLPSRPLLAFSDSSAKSITATHKCVCEPRVMSGCLLNLTCVNMGLQRFFHSASVNPLWLVSEVTCLAHMLKSTCAYSDHTNLVHTHKHAETQCYAYCHVLSVTYLSTPAWFFSNEQCTHTALRLTTKTHNCLYESFNNSGTSVDDQLRKHSWKTHSRGEESRYLLGVKVPSASTHSLSDFI